MHRPAMFDWVYIAMMVCCFLIRAPLDHRNRKIRAVASWNNAKERFLLILVGTGTTTLPLIYYLTPWLRFADYDVGLIAGCVGTVLAVLGVVLFRLSHRDLGRQFSPVLVLKEQHTLVSTGIYSRIRHPMYTALFTVAAAQLLLIGNAVAGPAFLVAFTLLYVVRIDNEERMMLAHFGQAYAEYQRRTGRLFPSPRR
jgi:protein-S-isoprenylcysteine O-methyltransferase Ste14